MVSWSKRWHQKVFLKLKSAPAVKSRLKSEKTLKTQLDVCEKEERPCLLYLIQIFGTNLIWSNWSLYFPSALESRREVSSLYNCANAWIPASWYPIYRSAWPLLLSSLFAPWATNWKFSRSLFVHKYVECKKVFLKFYPKPFYKPILYVCLLIHYF